MRFADFNLSDITFGEYNRGIALSMPNGDPLQFQIPRVYAPFGLSGFPNKFGPTKYNIDASLRGWNEEGSYVNKFYKFLTNIETVVLDHVRTLGLLPGDPSEHFNSNLKMSEKYDPKFRIKVDTKTLFFGPNEENLTPSELEEGLFKGKTFTALVELKNVYFFNKKIGLTWTIVQAKVYEPKRLHGLQITVPTDPSESWAESDETEKIGKFAFKLPPQK
jgi:hypothetical protein